MPGTSSLRFHGLDGGRPLGAGDMYVSGNKTVAIGYPPRGRNGRIQGVPGYLEWQALVLRNGAIILLSRMRRTGPIRESSRILGMHGVAESARSMQRERENASRTARGVGWGCGMAISRRVERLERQGLACQWTIREGI